jgi:hypothetical protein
LTADEVAILLFVREVGVQKLHLGVIHVRAPRMSVRMTAATMIAATGGNRPARCVPMGVLHVGKGRGRYSLAREDDHAFRFGTPALKIVLKRNSAVAQCSSTTRGGFVVQTTGSGR